MFDSVRTIFEWVQLFQLYYILACINLIFDFFARRQQTYQRQLSHYLDQEDEKDIFKTLKMNTNLNDTLDDKEEYQKSNTLNNALKVDRESQKMKEDVGHRLKQKQFRKALTKANLKYVSSNDINEIEVIF